MPDGKIIDPDFFQWEEWNQWGWRLVGFAVAWSPFEDVTLGLVLTIIGAFIAILTLVGITVFVIGIIFDVGGYYVNSYGLICMYYEIVEWYGFPTYGEAGYYTDQLLSPWGYEYIGWTFIPLSPNNFGPHTSIWPNGW